MVALICGQNRVIVAESDTANAVDRSYLFETDRLVLWRVTEDDYELFNAILSSPVLTRYLPNEAPYSQQQQRHYLDKRLQHWRDHGFGTALFADRNTPHLPMGFVGVEQTPTPGYLDIRYALLADYAGAGYTTEAAQGMLNFAFERSGHSKIYGVTMAENSASRAVLLKLGMEPENGLDLYQYPGLEYYSVTAASSIN